MNKGDYVVVKRIISHRRGKIIRTLCLICEFSCKDKTDMVRH